MSTEVSAQVMFQEGMRFLGSASSGTTVQLDAPASAGGGTGLTPMELLLISLAGCSAMDVIAILRKKRQPAEHLDVRVHGWRREEHSSVFTAIWLEYIVHGDDVDQEAVARAIELSKDRYCPVWAMLGQSVQITSSFRVVCDEAVYQ